MAENWVINAPLTPTTFDEYVRLFKRQHDILHYLVMEELGLQPGPERRVSEVIQGNQNNPLWKVIANQTPDIFVVQGLEVLCLGDVSVTGSDLPTRERSKLIKYSPLVSYLNSENYTNVIFRPFVFRQDGERVDDILSDSRLVRAQETLRIFRETKMKVLLQNPQWERLRLKDNESEAVFSKVNIDDLLKLPSAGVFRSEKDRKNFYTNKGRFKTPLELTPADNQFLEAVAMCGAKFMEPQVSMQEELKSLHAMMKERSNTKTPKPFLPIPYFEDGLTSACNYKSLKKLLAEIPHPDDVVRSIKRSLDAVDEKDFNMVYDVSLMFERDEWFQNTYLPYARANLPGFSELLPEEESNKSVWKRSWINDYVAKIKQRFPLRQTKKILVHGVLDIPSRQLFLEGPGMKKLIKRGDPEAINVSTKHNNMAMDPDVQANIPALMELLSTQSDKPRPDNSSLNLLHSSIGVAEKTAMKYLESYESTNLFRYLRMVQHIMREICLNATKHDQEKSPTRMRFRLIGANTILFMSSSVKLSGQNIKPIFYSIISKQPRHIHSAFPDVIDLGGGWWRMPCRSTDVQRLKNQLRCSDSAAMTWVQTSDITLNSSNWNSNIVDRYVATISVLFSLISLEDKITTSTFLGNSKYAYLKLLDVDPRFGDMKKKLSTPIRSTLHAFFFNNLVNYMSHTKIDLMQSFSMSLSVNSDEEESMVRQRIPSLFCQTDVDFQQWINELALVSAHNKDAGEKTHSTIGILDKMIKEEELLLEDEVSDPLFSSGYSNEMTDIEWALQVLNKPDRSHWFSARAHHIAFKLLCMDANDNFKGEEFVKVALERSKLTKPVDSLGTMKASVSSLCKIVPKEKMERLDFSDLGNRTKAIINCVKLLSEVQQQSIEDASLINLTDYCMKRLDIRVQIFKKNQRTGVREISILDFESRLCLNFCESIFESMCKLDNREMLTKGSEKISVQLSNMRKFVRESTKPSVILSKNEDKTTWNQRFICVQFAHLLMPAHAILDTNFKVIAACMEQMSNKHIEIPKDLAKTWAKNPDKECSEPASQKLKERFLKTGETSFRLKSSMLQGIVHYGSSLLHCACISFAEKLYQILIKKLARTSTIRASHIVSSDDRQTLIHFTSDAHSITNMSLHHRCHKIAERLFNIKTSAFKSFTSRVVHEFNSTFMSAVQVYSQLLKFTSTAVDIFKTDSFSDFVHSSYGAIEKLRENGASGSVTFAAHVLNSRFADHQFFQNTARETFGFSLNKLPYDYGVYPLFNSAMMDVLGPEYWNYSILQNTESKELKELFGSVYHMTTPTVRDLSELMEDPSICKHIRVKCSLLMSSLHKKALKTLNLDPEQVRNEVMSHTDLLIRKPTTVEEVLILLKMKLLSSGAKESFRDIAPVMYYARVNAYASANCFYLTGTDFPRTMTFTEATRFLHDTFKKPITEDDMKFFFPHLNTYRSVRHLEMFNSVAYVDRNPKQLLSLREATVREVELKLEVAPSLALKKWFDKTHVPGNAEERTFLMMLDRVPFLKDSIEETLLSRNVSDTPETRLGFLIELRKIFFKKTNHQRRYIMYGKCKTSVEETIRTLVEHNSVKWGTVKGLPNLKASDSEWRNDLEALVTFQNCVISTWLINQKGLHMPDIEFIMNSCKVNDIPFSKWLNDKWDLICRNPDKRLIKVFWVLMIKYLNTDQSQMFKLLEDCLFTAHHYRKPQSKNEKDEYDLNSDFSLVVVTGRCETHVQLEEGKLSISSNKLDHPHLIYSNLKRAFELVGWLESRSTDDDMIEVLSRFTWVDPNCTVKDNGIYSSLGLHLRIDNQKTKSGLYELYTNERYSYSLDGTLLTIYAKNRGKPFKISRGHLSIRSMRGATPIMFSGPISPLSMPWMVMNGVFQRDFQYSKISFDDAKEISDSMEPMIVSHRMKHLTEVLEFRVPLAFGEPSVIAESAHIDDEDIEEFTENMTVLFPSMSGEPVLDECSGFNDFDFNGEFEGIRDYIKEILKTNEEDGFTPADMFGDEFDLAMPAFDITAYIKSLERNPIKTYEIGDLTNRVQVLSYGICFHICGYVLPSKMSQEVLGFLRMMSQMYDRVTERGKHFFRLCSSYILVKFEEKLLALHEEYDDVMKDTYDLQSITPYWNSVSDQLKIKTKAFRRMMF